jgi:peptidoglycan hydrolase-like protein with peptidoglycan-binding domain
MFVSWVYDKAGHPIGKIDDAKGYRDCNSAFWKWKASKEITTSPEMGDIVLFDWEGDGKCNHTGIFHEWSDSSKKSFWSYEGNTSSADDSNGGLVMRRKRNLATVKAFVKPKVLAGENSIEIILESVIKKGRVGAEVTKLQKQLYDLGFKITVDGDFGNETEKIVKQFQKENKLQLTGEVTLVLLGFIEAKLSKSIVSDDKLTTGVFLKKGNSGQPVIILQNALNKKGAKPKLIIDGVFGDATVKAVKDFQKKNKLKVDGIVGPQTLNVLGVK